MFPLVGVAVSLLPELVKLIAGDKAGKIANNVSEVIGTVTGTQDPVLAKQKIDADPAIAADLQQKLAQIAIEAAKVQTDEADKIRQDQLDQLKASFGDTADARSAMVQLADTTSISRYGPITVSVIVAIGFFVVLGLTINKTIMDNDVAYTLDGTMATAFATMVSFWLGSSQGSRDKDKTVRDLQLTHSQQTGQLLSRIQANQISAPAATAAPDTSIARFKACLDVLFTLEGGYSDERDDPGGPTKYGITLRTLADFRHVAPDPALQSEVQNLSSEEAASIYRTKFWNVMQCDLLPAGVDMMVFHFGVNAGPTTAARVMQDCTGAKIDGSIGPATLATVSKFEAPDLISALGDKQLAYYHGLANWASYSTGWSKRVAQAIAAAMRMAQKAGS